MNNTTSLLTIDGSHGEGGGQILRTALALSLVTGTPFRLVNIRAGRSKPGLMRQHLTAVQAAARIGQATVEGAFIGSREIAFYPNAVQAGEYAFAIGTAGSATLVLQTILPALLTAKQPSTLVLEGGTHNPYAPPFDFLQRSFLPLLNRMGATVETTLERYGFYPAGGGKFTVHITPTAQLQPLTLVERGAAVQRAARALITASLERSIAERELAIVQSKLSWHNDAFTVEEVRNSPGPGNILFLEIEHDNVTEICTGFGEHGVWAEKVAERAVRYARQYLASPAPVGVYLADQLLLPLALAGSGCFRTVALSSHTHTNMDIIRHFLSVPIATEKEEHSWMVRIGA